MITKELIEKVEDYLMDYEELLREKRISIKKVRELIDKYNSGEITKEELEKLKRYIDRILKVVKKEEEKRKQKNLLAFLKK